MQHAISRRGVATKGVGLNLGCKHFALYRAKAGIILDLKSPGQGSRSSAENLKEYKLYHEFWLILFDLPFYFVRPCSSF